MAEKIPDYARHVPRRLLVRYMCKRIGKPHSAWGETSRDDWAVGDNMASVTVKCLRCGFEQNDLYNWKRAE